MQDQNNWRGTVEMFRRAATSKGRVESGYYSIEGLRLHERALRAGVKVEKVITVRTLFEDLSERIQALIQELRLAGCQITVVPEEIMQSITIGRELGPILGLVKMPSQPQLADVLTASGQEQPLLLVAVEVQDPGNVGALLRTGHAAGTAAFVTVGVSDPFHPRALRTSRGSLFKMPVLHYGDICTLMADLREREIEIVGTYVNGGTPLNEASFSANGTAVLIGSEAWGLPAQMQSAVDQLLSIPMSEGVDSYAVNAAAAIVLYEINRRKL